METEDIDAICKKYKCFMDFLDYIYIIVDGKWTKIGRVYYKNGWYYPETINSRNLGGDKKFEIALQTLLKRKSHF